MKRSTLLMMFCLGILSVSGQSLTGIWRGYFSSSAGIYRDQVQQEVYKYEIQILQSPNKAMKGVTFSYKTTVFYGKAKAQGIYNTGSKTLLLKETEMLDLKVGDKSEPCLMTCYLDYSKMGKLEVLQGTFISQNIRDKGDCGSGKVYLEKVPVSDFETESFLKHSTETDSAKKTKTTPAPSAAPLLADKKSNPKPGSAASPSAQSPKPIGPNPLPQTKPAPSTASATKPVPKPVPAPKANSAVAPATAKAKTTTPLPKTPVLATPKTKPETESKTPPAVAPTTGPVALPPAPNQERQPETTISNTPTKKMPPLPPVLRERENNLVRTLEVEDPNILIELYDNGTIDNDSISVYHNNELVIRNGRLSYSPLTVKIQANATERFHDLVVVAENLGEIAPNTALMVVTAGKKRYEVFLASNEKRNAKVRIEFTGK
ncbi:MAG: hypothetical protein EAZ62_02505 [Sphingobacteriia bacterium]|nr:MAG: hypothetical protein EAZ62_02505 [Sphingobacteriia bacterium]